MRLFILKNLHIIGALFISFGIPIGVHILPENYDLLFLPIGVLFILISWYYTFEYKNK
jgi:1,4-dihydroxy-2-naphthoate octaprenyltransferase